MFSKTEILQLFPTCVWQHELGEAAELNRQLLDALETMRATTASRGDVPGCWQSPGNLHALPEFERLTEAIVTALQQVMDFLQIEHQGLIVTNTWANITSEGTSHRLHTHPNNLLSGVYYVRIPENAGKIVFEDPRTQAHVMVPAYRSRTLHNSGKYTIPVSAGLLLIFPSWFEHSVEAHGSEVERVSIAFNAVPKGRLGFESAQLVI